MGIRVFLLHRVRLTHACARYAGVPGSVGSVAGSAPAKWRNRHAPVRSGFGHPDRSQFLLFAEVAASATLIGGITFALALSFTDGIIRRSLFALVPQVGAAYATAAIILSPYLYFMFAFGHPAESVFDPTLLGADL